MIAFRAVLDQAAGGATLERLGAQGVRVDDDSTTAAPAPTEPVKPSPEEPDELEEA